jgi:hypothetical protein
MAEPRFILGRYVARCRKRFVCGWCHAEQEPGTHYVWLDVDEAAPPRRELELVNGQIRVCRRCWELSE